MGEKEPSVFEYNDFRRYLADFYGFHHLKDKSFTKSAFSVKLSLPNTRSFFNDVLEGKKVTSTFVERFIKVLQFDEHEANYFRVLVKHNQSENSDERMLYFEQLISLNKTPCRTLDKKLFAYYRNWYNSVVRAILSYIDFNNDYVALARKVQPPITSKQARESIELMLSLDLIKKNGDGFFKPTERSIKAPDYISDELIRLYQISCAELSKRSITRNFPTTNIVATNMFSISKEGLKTIEQLTHKYRSEIRACANKDEFPPEYTYQMNLYLFPCAQ